jgi:hypothetical protein
MRSYQNRTLSRYYSSITSPLDENHASNVKPTITLKGQKCVDLFVESIVAFWVLKTCHLEGVTA